jgi:hypothetical protein
MLNFSFQLRFNLFKREVATVSESTNREIIMKKVAK